MSQGMRPKVKSNDPIIEAYVEATDLLESQYQRALYFADKAYEQAVAEAQFARDLAQGMADRIMGLK